MKKIGIFAAVAALFFLFIAIIYGWVLNLINVIDGTYDQIGAIVAGAIGIFIVPVGALVHYIAG